VVSDPRKLTRPGNSHHNSSSPPTSEASDGGKAIIAGNDGVIRRDCLMQVFLRDRSEDEAGDRLPEVREDRVSREARPRRAHPAHRTAGGGDRAAVGADVEKTKRAALLAKADLLTEVVGEFPELQA